MKLKNIPFAMLVGLVISLTLFGCSDDQSKTNTSTDNKAAMAPQPFNPFDHSKDKVVPAAEKDRFETVFAEQCVKREMLAAPNSDRERFVAPCTCIADQLAKNLTAKEAEKFMTEHENPVSLTFKFENAAYHCVQEKAAPKDSGFNQPTPEQ
jgi:hypothetical protein